MKLRTRVKLAAVIAVGVFLGYGAAVLYMDRSMSHLSQEMRNANQFSYKITLLRTLSLDTLIYQTERSRRQWTAVYDEVRHLLVDKAYLDLRLEYDLGDIGDKVKIVGDTFQRLLTMPGGERPDDPEPEINRQLRHRLTTQLMLTTQDLLNRFFTLQEEVNQQLIRRQRLISFLDILALLSLGLIIFRTGNFLQRSVLKPVLKLHEGAEIIGAGNLDYKVGMETPDELGELSRTFDRMIGNLQKVTVSRDVLAREVAERKQAEEALRESREDLNRAQAVAHVGSWRLDVRKNELTWSDETYGMFGIPRGTALTYERFLSAVHPEDRLNVDQKWQAALTGEVYDIEHRIIVDGQMKWVQEQAELEFDHDGRLSGGFGTVQDITERKRAEKALIRAKEEWERTFDAVSDFIALLDKEHRITRMNKAMAELLGKAAEGAIGQPCFKAVHGLAEAPDFCPHAKVLSTGQAQSTEVLEFDRTFAVSVSPIFAPDGQLAGGVHVARDITESKRAQEALEDRSAELMQAVAALEATNAEMERFTYMISHDLKSPLVTISTFLSYLEEDLRNGDTARIDKDLHFMRTAAAKMGQLLSELLEMSRIGRLTNPPVEFSFQELVGEVLQAVAGAIAARGVAVETQPADIMLFGDRPRLVEIWQNLVENAIKYMGEQVEPRLTLGLEQQAGEVIFFVCDNGMGIDPHYQGKIFGLFEKLDAKSGGSGIGLAIVKRIVELYQGKIWVESPGLNQGACFRFTLPGAVRRDSNDIS
jgi:PAS domain S-box-containing protein